MALLPVLLDMVEEIYSNLDNPEKTIGDIPLLFVPHGRRGGRDCPKRKEHGHHGFKNHGHNHHSDSSDEDSNKKERHCGRKEKQGCRFAEFRRGHCPYGRFSGCSKFGGRRCPGRVTSSDDFKVTFDVKSFMPEEISVKVKGREIHVDAKHDERADEHGFVSRQLTRRYVVPSDYDIDTVATYLDSDGKMTVVATKPKPAAEETAERVIPIERVASVQEEVGEALKEMNLMDDEPKKSE